MVLLGAGAGCHVADTDGLPPLTDQADPLILIDDAGRTWSFLAPPRRIVSLVPAATDMLVTLGVGEYLVGRTDFDNLPEGLEGLPSVGGGLGPSIEVIASLAPDLVIRFEGPSDPETAARLDQLGIPHLGIRPDGIDDILRIVSLLGQVTDRNSEARALADQIQTTLREVKEAAEGVTPVRVAILLGGDPPWVAGGTTFVHELAVLAGAENVLAGATLLYGPMSVEEIRRQNPDLLLLTRRGQLPAGLRGMAYRVAPESLVIPGPEIGEAARVMFELLHSGHP